MAGSAVALGPPPAGTMGAVTDDPDAAYQPLAGPDAWQEASSAVDGGQWRAGVERMAALAERAPAWADMVGRGMRLMAAYWSGAMAGLYEGDDVVALGLLAGTTTPLACGPAVGPHVVANHAAIVLASPAGAAAPSSSPSGDASPAVAVLAAEAGADPLVISEALVRRVHAVACQPQVTHPVATDHGVHHHVLGHGDYKHHPNHIRTAAGGWRAFAPVASVGAEMASLVSWLRSPPYAALHPVARAAYALHAFHHVGPFAAGNGRVARAVATRPLVAARSVPLVVPVGETDAYRAALETAGKGSPAGLVRFVEQRCANVVGLVTSLHDRPAGPDEAAALHRWEARVRAAHRLQAILPLAVEAALVHHRRRTDLGWMADLAAARMAYTIGGVDTPRFDDPPLSIQVPLVGGSVAEELLAVDPHPLTAECDVVILRAMEAEMEIHVRPEQVAPPIQADLERRIDELLERAVTALAVRAAALDGD